MPTRHTLRHWFVAAGMTAALFAVLAAVSNFRFENSDDVLLVKAFMGFEGGAPANFSLYTHTLLAWALYGLGRVAPAVPWFSVFQGALLLAGGTVAVKCILQLAERSGWRAVWGLVGGASFLSMFAAFACCRVNYTTTAALAAAAAVLQFATVEPFQGKRGKTVRGYGLGLILLALGYCLRYASVMPALPYLALLLMWQGARQWKATHGGLRSLWPLLLGAGTVAAMLLMLWGIRQAEIALRGLQPYLDWQNARTALMDFTAFADDPAPALAAGLGYAPSTLAMVRAWYFMDASITTDMLRALRSAYPAHPSGAAFAQLGALYAQNPRYLYSTLATLILCVALCLRGRSPLTRLAAPLAVLGGGMMLLYLGWQGRLPGRAADAVFFPCAALLLALWFSEPPAAQKRPAWRRALAAALAAAALLAVGMNAKLTLHDITRAPDIRSQVREADLETYALAHANTLVVRSPALLRDTRLWPAVRGGLPANIMIWGDWTCRTPSWYAQLARLGFDGPAFTAADWLRGNILLATADDAEMAALRAYMSDALGVSVQAVPAGQAGEIALYRFQAADTGTAGTT